MPTRNINLTKYYDDFIAENVDSGNYSNASEVVRDGLRLLAQKRNEEEAKLKYLRKATKEAFAALDNGEGLAFDSVSDVSAHLKHLQKIATSASK